MDYRWLAASLLLCRDAFGADPDIAKKLQASEPAGLRRN